MRYRFIILPLFVLQSIAACGQGEDAKADSTHGIPWSLEGRVGAAWLSTPVTLEARAHLSPRYSIDLGARPFPLSLYAGATWYPGGRTLLQFQSGYMKLSQPGGDDAPGFESEFYAGVRCAVRTGKLSDSSKVWYTIGVGAYALLDIDYCGTCGTIDPDRYVPEYGRKFSWTPFLEIGLGGWLR